MQSKSWKAAELDSGLTWKLGMPTLDKHDSSVLKENYSVHSCIHLMYIINIRDSQTSVCMDITCSVIKLQISEAFPKPVESIYLEMRSENQHV